MCCHTSYRDIFLLSCSSRDDLEIAMLLIGWPHIYIRSHKSRNIQTSTWQRELIKSVILAFSKSRDSTVKARTGKIASQFSEQDFTVAWNVGLASSFNRAWCSLTFVLHISFSSQRMAREERWLATALGMVPKHNPRTFEPNALHIDTILPLPGLRKELMGGTWICDFDCLEKNWVPELMVASAPNQAFQGIGRGEEV